MRKINSFLILAFLIISNGAFAQAPSIVLQNFASGFTKPTDIQNCKDSRVFIVEQDGYINIVDNGVVNPTPFLNIDVKVKSTGNEQGLLGLAFHPDYKQNGYFYVDYTDNNAVGNTVISRFSVSAADSNLADPNSEVILLTIVQPFTNHNGGCVRFGPDGYLYIGMGDGGPGSGGDPNNRAQNKNDLLGKILRIDVDHGLPYTIPPDNPFVNVPNTKPEIWAYGVRNPWRYSFDRLNGDYWMADVGQNLWEEVDFEPAGTPGGLNYGWRCYESNHAFNTTGCQPQSNYVPAIYELSHNNGYCSITGGYIYRGGHYSNMFGYYFFADYCDDMIQVLKRNANGTFQQYNTINYTGAAMTTFGEDQYGDLYVSNRNNGQIKKIVSSICSPTAFIAEEDTMYVCADSVELSTPFADSLIYSWQTPGGTALTNSIWVTQDGWSKVVVQNYSGCLNSDSVYVVILGNPPAAIITGLDSVYCSNTSPADTISGSPAGGIFTGPGITGNKFYADSAGNGTFIIRYNFTDAFGCVSSTFQQIKVSTCVGINQTESQLLTIIGANPASGHLSLKIESSLTGTGKYSVVDVSGRKISNGSLDLVKGNQLVNIPMDNAENGIYFWRFSYAESTVTYRFIWVK